MDADTLQAVRAFVKRAEPTVQKVSPQAYMEGMPQHSLYAKTLKQMALASLLGGGAMAGLRMLIGGGTMPQEGQSHAIRVVLPSRRKKVAEGIMDMFTGKGETDPKRRIFGRVLPGAALMAGGYGGWKLIDHMLDRRRKQQLNNEVEKAKQMYEQALNGGADVKIASENTLFKELDELADLAIKSAAKEDGFLTNTFNSATSSAGRTLGSLLSGPMAVFGLPIAALSYLAMRNAVSNNAPGTIVNKALAKKKRLNWQMSPPTVMATLPGEDEEGEEKIASDVAKPHWSTPLIAPAAVAGLSSLLGLGLAPEGHAGEGALRGGLKGLGTFAGGVAGLGLGTAAGGAVGHSLARDGSFDPASSTLGGAVVGGLGGGPVGALLGYQTADSLLGEPSWEKERRKRELLQELAQGAG